MLLLAFSTQFLLLDRMKIGIKNMELLHVVARNSKNHFSSFYFHIPADNTGKLCFSGMSLELIVLSEKFTHVHL